jgi:hypothetical protein
MVSFHGSLNTMCAPSDHDVELADALLLPGGSQSPMSTTRAPVDAGSCAPSRCW